ncbi:hypothetical protein K438DRAFT_1930569 [Mycena galopus ATCC 62051]|nr:hypothetical protein K438DRAFT_1930569 [Mycena galopus ATCC 62051]
MLPFPVVGALIRLGRKYDFKELFQWPTIMVLWKSEEDLKEPHSGGLRCVIEYYPPQLESTGSTSKEKPTEMHTNWIGKDAEPTVHSGICVPWNLGSIDKADWVQKMS